jgi:ABC-type arginine/histidine transport system permease subunit
VFVATELASHAPGAAGLPPTAGSSFSALLLVVPVMLVACCVVTRCMRRYKCASLILCTIILYYILYKCKPIIIGMFVVLFGDRNFSFEHIT